MFAIATPAKQTAEDTITTLAGRLSSATLLEDRRAAVLGLKSFSSSYPATVSSNALRGLIGCLHKDRQDVDTCLATLQTLLQLFNPNESSPEASEEIALWVADEFTQIQDNITLLLEFLDTHDFYSKLCSLQLLAAILLSRTDRTKELMCAAPLGISKLVSVLDDKRDVIRNEGLSILIYLTPNSIDLQKRVAFEDVFERIFNIIKDEGSLLNGDAIVEDCLILLANLLRLNESNQTYFREMGFVPKIARLLSEVAIEKNEESELAEWARSQRNRNLYALLAVLRLFLVTGSATTQVNQLAFWQSGVLNLALEIAFNHSTEIQIRAEALITCADIIRAEPKLQENFAQLKVASISEDSFIEGVKTPNEIPQNYVIDGLLELALSISAIKAFDSRIAACECIKAYLCNHSVIRQHFLRRAIDGYVTGEDVTPNFLTILLQPSSTQAFMDPYRSWFAAVIFFHLIFDDPNTKTLAMSVREGDSANGEEEVTCLQNLTGNFFNALKRNVDARALSGYLMLLCGWLFEDLNSVNDYLGEASHLHGLVQVVLDMTSDSPIVQGLCAMLLGILYEFSTKDSPIPRFTIFQVLTSQLGRDKYIDRLSKLRSNHLLRDFEVLPQKLTSALVGGLPEVFFDSIFVEFVKDNFSRLLRAFDRDPDYEIPVLTNGVQMGISRELVDSLRTEIEEKSRLLEKYQEDLIVLGKQREHEQADKQRSNQAAEVELNKVKQINLSLQRRYEELTSKLNQENDQVSKEYQRKFEEMSKTAQNDVERTRETLESRIQNLQKIISKLEIELDQCGKNLQDLQKAHEMCILRGEKDSTTILKLEKRVNELEERCCKAEEDVISYRNSLLEKEKEKNATQTELEDLLIVFTDVEEKVTNYKERLVAMGETVSDAEDEEGTTE